MPQAARRRTPVGRPREVEDHGAALASELQEAERSPRERSGGSRWRGCSRSGATGVEEATGVEAAGRVPLVEAAGEAAEATTGAGADRGGGRRQTTWGVGHRPEDARLEVPGRSALVEATELEAAGVEGSGPELQLEARAEGARAA